MSAVVKANTTLSTNGCSFSAFWNDVNNCCIDIDDDDASLPRVCLPLLRFNNITDHLRQKTLLRCIKNKIAYYLEPVETPQEIPTKTALP